MGATMCQLRWKLVLLLPTLQEIKAISQDLELDGWVQICVDYEQGKL